MKLIKRAIKYNLRNYKRVLLLASLFLVIGNFLMFTVIIIMTNNNIKTEVESNVTPEFSISYNWTQCNETDHCGMNSITEKFNKIGMSDLVKNYEYNSVFNFELVNAITSVDPLQVNTTNGMPSIIGMGSNRNIPIDFEKNRIILTTGSLFSLDDIEKGNPIVIISDYLAEVNNLKVGDPLIVKTTVYDSSVGIETDFSLIDPLDEASITLEVIGTFKPNISVIEEGRGSDDTYTNIMRGAEKDVWNMTIIVPELIITDFSSIKNDFYQKYRGQNLANPMPNNYFELKTINDTAEFIKMANQTLGSTAYSVNEVNTDYKTVLAPLRSLTNQSTILLGGTVAVSIIIVGLIIMVETKKRTKEFGIYLALGQSKIKIILLLILEISLIGLISFSISIFTGEIIANVYSQNMIENKIELYHKNVESKYDFLNKETIVSKPIYNDIDFSEVESYHVKLSSKVIVIYYTVSMLVLIISTVSTAVFILKLKPKELLLSR